MVNRSTQTAGRVIYRRIIQMVLADNAGEHLLRLMKTRFYVWLGL
jgi:hypothetical protein